MSSSPAAAAGCECAPAAISADPSSSATTSYSDASPWMSLQADLVDLVGWRVLATGDLLDYVRLRAACAHWRASTASPRGRGILDPRFHPRHWIMLPPAGTGAGETSAPTTGRFVNRSTGARAHQRLPLLGDHIVLNSVDGILLLLQKQQGSGGAHNPVRLLHPFTGDSLDLPPLLSPTTTAALGLGAHPPRPTSSISSTARRPP